MSAASIFPSRKFIRHINIFGATIGLRQIHTFVAPTMDVVKVFCASSRTDVRWNHLVLGGAFVPTGEKLKNILLDTPEARSKTRVGIVSSEPIRLAGIFSVFTEHPTILLVEGDLASLMRDGSLSILILDLSSNENWHEALVTIRRIRPDIRLIVLGPVGDDDLVLRSILLGTRAFLDDRAGLFAIRHAVETVVEGSIWAPRRILSILIDRLRSQTGAAPVVQPEFSFRERQVLDLIMKANSNREIAVALGIEERTVKVYVTRLLRKCGVDNRVSLSVQATQDSWAEGKRGAK